VATRARSLLTAAAPALARGVAASRGRGRALPPPPPAVTALGFEVGGECLGGGSVGGLFIL
jgi:hypothetical protein